MAQLTRTFSNSLVLNGHCKIVNDPIHGYIDLEPELLKYIDTPQFQRLRDLKQLGSSYYVFPGASHNRFEHSLGTAHLAGTMIANIRRYQPELEISDREVFLVKAAGLCHDLGHGPFSHVFDNEFIPRARPDLSHDPWNHEQGSLMMLDYLLSDNGIDVSSDDVRLLKALIHPEPDSVSSSPKPFLFDIVANSRNSLDVDKFDYIARDCMYVNIKGSYDFQRLVKHCKVIDNEICFHSKEAFNIYEMFHTRYSLHKRVYSHRVSKAVEFMITDALLAADPCLQISAAIEDPERYCQLTDCILRQIESSQDKAMGPAQQIMRRIRKRQLYHLVAEHALPISDDVVRATEDDIVRHQPAGGNLRSSDIIVNNLRISYAMQNRNPVDLIHFFDDWDHPVAKRLPKEAVSSLIPDVFEERRLRVYTRNPDDKSKSELAIQAVAAFLKARLDSVGRVSAAISTPIKRPHSEVNSFNGASSGGMTPARSPVRKITEFFSMSPCPTPVQRPLKRTRSMSGKNIFPDGTPSSDPLASNSSPSDAMQT